MEYQKIDQKSYQIHTIKTNRYKTTKIEVFFRLNATKDNLAICSFLANILNECSYKYPTRKDISIKLEELYKTYYYVTSTKIGNSLNLIFTINFINPEYIEDKNYLKEVIKFLFEVILKPNVKNNEFIKKSFSICQNNLLLDLESLEENAEKNAINNALKNLDSNSLTSYNILGTKEEILNITEESLYKFYNYIMNNALIDIFIVGNTNHDNIVHEIKNNFKIHKIRTNKINYYIENKTTNKVKEIREKSKFSQTNLIMLYNLVNLTKDEKEITLFIFNYILGSGGLSSKLYRYIREENSYCYRVSSMYFKYDNLLCIASSLDIKNINDTIKLVHKSINEMKKGIFSEDDINDAKKNLLLALNINKNNPSSILSSYEFNYFLGNYLIEEKINKINSITKKDIINIAKKLKENIIYILCEDENEKNSN